MRSVVFQELVCRMVSLPGAVTSPGDLTGTTGQTQRGQWCPPPRQTLHKRINHTLFGAAVSPGRLGSAGRPRRRPRSWLSWWRSCWGCGPETKPPWPCACSSWPWPGWWRGSRCGSPCGSEQRGRTFEDTESIWRGKRGRGLERKTWTGSLGFSFNCPQINFESYLWILLSG